MKFWDSSAIVPLLIEESESEKVRILLKEDPQILVWTLTPVECFSALFRKHRESEFSIDELTVFRSRLRSLEKSWNEVTNTDLVKQRAERLLGTHKLRAGDSLQLAAALVAYEDKPQGAQFVTFDITLAHAAALEGFSIVS